MEKHNSLVGILNIVYRTILFFLALLLITIAFWFNHFIDTLVRWGEVRSHEYPPL